MKKVWVLERFSTAEEMQSGLNQLKKWLLQLKEKSSNHVTTIEKSIVRQQELIDEYPEGMWVGVEGKILYHEFCKVAKQAIRMNPSAKFRVIEAEIEDTAQYWLGYINGVENKNVLKYFRASA